MRGHRGPSATSRLRARCSGVGSVAKGYRGSVASRMIRLRLPRLDPTAERRSDPAPYAPPGDTHAEKHDERREEQDDGQEQRRRQVSRAKPAVDCQRHGLGYPGEIAGKHDGGSELPEGSRPGKDRAGDEAGGDQGQRDRPKYLAGRRSEIGRGGFDITIDPRKTSPGGDNVERSRHEDLRHDDGDGGEPNRNSTLGKPLPDQ